MSRTECRNGHDLTGPNARVWTGGHLQCRACRRQSQARADRTYNMTANGFIKRGRAQDMRAVRTTLAARIGFGS